MSELLSFLLGLRAAYVWRYAGRVYAEHIRLEANERIREIRDREWSEGKPLSEMTSYLNE